MLISEACRLQNDCHMNSVVLNELKEQLLNPITEGQEIIIVFYTDANHYLYKYLLGQTNANLYFVKWTKDIYKLFDDIFVWTLDEFILPFSMKISPLSDGSDFYYEILDDVYRTPSPLLNGNSTEEFISVFINNLPNINKL